jgi:hypothetical protein
MMVQPQIRDVVRGQNRYCGPAAISIIAGIDTTRTAKLLRQVSGKTMICGVATCHVRSALRRLGYELREVKFKGKTLAQWLSSDRSQTAMFLVTSGHHYSIVQGDRYCCGQTKTVVSVSNAPHRRSRMESVHEVVKVSDVNPDTIVPVPPKDMSWLRRIQVTRKAKQHGIECYQEDASIWVYPPDGLFGDGDEEKDPFYGEHCHDDWDSAEKAVDTYAQLKNQPPQVLPIAACPNSQKPSP